MAIPEVITAVEAQFNEFDIVVDPRTRGPMPGVRVYEGTADAYNWVGPDAQKIVVELGIPQAANIEDFEPRNEALRVGKLFATWLKGQETIGDMLTYAGFPIRINVNPDPDRQGSVMLIVEFHVCDVYPYV